MNGWRIALVLLGILFVFWVILSVLLSSWMTNQWHNEWWEIVVALIVLWLFYGLIVYLARYVCYDERECDVGNDKRATRLASSPNALCHSK